jgi:hypothetical protein
VSFVFVIACLLCISPTDESVSDKKPSRRN